MAADETMAPAEGMLYEGKDSVATQVPFALVVEWSVNATDEQKEKAQEEIRRLMEEITKECQEGDGEVLPPGIERMTIKRV